MNISRTRQLRGPSLVNFALLAMLIYSIMVFRYSFNFPYLDDYDAILRFLNRQSIVPRIEAFLMIFDQHNEHRIVLARIVTLMSLKIFGVIDFRILIYFGNLAWIMVVGILWRYAQRRGVTFSEFVPVILILLSFSHWEMMTWTMTSIVQYWQVLFCLLSIYALTTGRLIMAGIFCILGVFSGGGAITLLPLICIYFICQSSWRYLFYFLLLFGIILLTYFVFLPYILPGSSQLFEVIKHPFYFLAFIFGFLGGAINLSFIGPASFIGSGMLIFGLLIKNFHSFYRQNDFLTWSIIFILMYAILGAINRSYLGLDAGGISYYSVYSLVLISCIYLKSILSINTLKDRSRVLTVGILFGVLLFSYWSWRAPIYLEDKYHLLSHGYIIYPDKLSAEKVLEISKAMNIYIPPVTPLK